MYSQKKSDLIKNSEKHASSLKRFVVSALSKLCVVTAPNTPTATATFVFNEVVAGACMLENAP
eukprot:2275046-Pleurochrysis_carterae.AAC.5